VTVVELGLYALLLAAAALAVWRRPVVSLYLFVVGLALHNAVLAALYAGGVRGATLTAMSAWKEILLAVALGRVGLDAWRARRLPFRFGIADWLAVAFGALVVVYVLIPQSALGGLAGHKAVALAFQPEDSSGPTADWRTDIKQLFHSWRAAVRRHPNIAPVVGTQLASNTDVRFELVERILTDLTRAGFEGPALMGAYNSIIASLVGFVAQEFASIPREGLTAFQSEIKDRLLSVDSQAYPILAANVPMLANHAFILRWQNGVEAPLNDSFDFYIDLVIDGLEAAMKAAKRKPIAA